MSEQLSTGSSDSAKRIVAFVSGKGGSGKTMVTALFAQSLFRDGEKVIIFDADTGTAGMTYYLGLSKVKNIRIGLYDVARKSPRLFDDPEFLKRALQPIDGYED